jgi:hypothetical protein
VEAIDVKHPMGEEFELMHRKSTNTNRYCRRETSNRKWMFNYVIKTANEIGDRKGGCKANAAHVKFRCKKGFHS